MVDHSNGRTNTGFSIDSCSNDGDSRNLLDDEIRMVDYIIGISDISKRSVCG